MSAYDNAVTELSRVPLDQYIAERKRLAGELKAAGDKTGARVLGTRPRPPISAWAVNQLYWHARDAFDELLETADRLRKGDLKASGAHRDALGKLRKRAATILEDAGHNANEATLRRVAQTLSAIAATGDWGEDAPGTIVADRDPPGFEAVGIPAEKVVETIAAKPAAKHHDGHAKHDRHEHDGEDKTSKAAARAAEKEAEREAAERRAAEMAEKKVAEEERKRVAAEKHRLETALRTAKIDLHEHERTVKSLEKDLEAAARKVTKAQELVSDLEEKLEELRGNGHN